MSTHNLLQNILKNNTHIFCANNIVFVVLLKNLKHFFDKQNKTCNFSFVSSMNIGVHDIKGATRTSLLWVFLDHIKDRAPTSFLCVFSDHKYSEQISQHSRIKQIYNYELIWNQNRLIVTLITLILPENKILMTDFEHIVYYRIYSKTVHIYYDNIWRI